MDGGALRRRPPSLLEPELGRLDSIGKNPAAGPRPALCLSSARRGGGGGKGSGERMRVSGVGMRGWGWAALMFNVSLFLFFIFCL